jgi:CheY-like chemotaxis protein
MSLVLIVEDDAHIRAALLMILDSEGYEVAEAADGQQALDWLRAGGKPDLILLDLMMPGLDGWQFLARRTELPQAMGSPVLVLSGADIKLVPAGADGMLKKPVSIDALLSTVEGYLGKPG